MKGECRGTDNLWCSASNALSILFHPLLGDQPDTGRIGQHLAQAGLCYNIFHPAPGLSATPPPSLTPAGMLLAQICMALTYEQSRWTVRNPMGPYLTNGGWDRMGKYFFHPLGRQL